MGKWHSTQIVAMCDLAFLLGERKWLSSKDCISLCHSLWRWRNNEFLLGTQWLGEASGEVVWCVSKAVCEPSPRDPGSAGWTLSEPCWNWLGVPRSNRPTLPRAPQAWLKRELTWAPLQQSAKQLCNPIAAKDSESTTQVLLALVQNICQVLGISLEFPGKQISR